MKRCWYDHFNDVVYRTATEAEAATRGGNVVTPLTIGNFADVQGFHDKFGLDRDRPTAPRTLPEDLARFRLGFLIEELAEYARSVGATEIARALNVLAVEARTAEIEVLTKSLVGAFDGLLDLVVVAVGTADFHGFPWEAGWDVVLARNLAKKRAEPDGSDSKRHSPWDVVKPPGWYGPEAELRALLEVKP